MMSMKQEQEVDILTLDPQIYKFPGRSKSSVWNHFGFQKGSDGELDKSRAVCKICRQGIRYSGNTTNLHCHLTKHRRENTGLFEDLDESWMHASPDFKFKYVDSVVQSTVEDIKAAGNIQTTSSTTDDNKSGQRSKHQQLNDTIVNFFIEHLLPLSVVESTSFYSMIAVADPMYVVPDKEYLFGNLIHQFYIETKKSIASEISGNEVITVAEVWESITGEKFVSISVQLINTQWQMKTFLLKTVSLNSVINEDVFLRLFKATCEEWEIKSSTTLLNDGSNVIQKAITSLRLVNMPSCTTGLLTAGENLMKNQTVTKSVIEQVILIIGQILQDKSPADLYGKMFEIIKDYKEIEAKTFSWTAFNSVISCIIENKQSFKTTDMDSKLNLTDERWQEISDMEAVLSPIQKAYKLLSDNSSVISSMILPILRKLEMALASKKSDSEFIKVLKKATWSSISTPFNSTAVRKFLLISSLLDPRYKDLQFVETTEKTQARELLGTVATEMYRERNRTNGSYDGEIIVVEESGDVIRIEPMEKRQKLDHQENRNGTDDWLADVVCKDNPVDKGSDKEEKVLVEIDHYISTQQVSTPPLQWWSSRENLYPTLSRLARRYLCMNNFSVSENNTVKNAKLSPETVDKLLFLHHNYYGR
ncbi:E3 SUMO-protein ligase ZBED1-like [Mytilus galloprovincialis]|uniref:E3 SUMO-protein ligase ZBED1-like n=1 Tax=Mytilus galloprovincialis TaxID=29158 RepID=UPI003F7BFD70